MRKQESALRTIDKVKEKCQTQFARQDSVYQKYEEIGDSFVYN